MRSIESNLETITDGLLLVLELIMGPVAARFMRVLAERA